MTENSGHVFANIRAPYMYKVKDVFLLGLIVAKVKDVLYGVKSCFPPFPRKIFGGQLLLSVVQKMEPNKTKNFWRSTFAISCAENGA